MQSDPFGNLTDWGPVLQLLEELSDKGLLDECQPGLTRILAYKDNWRLREETLQRIQLIERPNGQLIGQIINMIADNNLYYEIRILACEAIGTLLARNHHPFYASLQPTLLKTLTAQLSVPQPINFRKALESTEEMATLKFRIVNND